MALFCIAYGCQAKQGESEHCITHASACRTSHKKYKQAEKKTIPILVLPSEVMREVLSDYGIGDLLLLYSKLHRAYELREEHRKTFFQPQYWGTSHSKWMNKILLGLNLCETLLTEKVNTADGSKQDIFPASSENDVGVVASPSSAPEKEVERIRSTTRRLNSKEEDWNISIDALIRENNEMAQSRNKLRKLILDYIKNLTDKAGYTADIPTLKYIYECLMVVFYFVDNNWDKFTSDPLVITIRHDKRFMIDCDDISLDNFKIDYLTFLKEQPQNTENIVTELCRLWSERKGSPISSDVYVVFFAENGRIKYSWSLDIEDFWDIVDTSHIKRMLAKKKSIFKKKKGFRPTLI